MVMTRNGPTVGQKGFGDGGFVGNTREILEDARETGRFLILHFSELRRAHSPPV